MADDQVEMLLREARVSTENEMYSQAFQLYLRAFRLLPALKLLYRDMFFNVFKQLYNSMQGHNDFEGSFRVYQLARHVYPASVDILIVMGKTLLDNGCYLEAWKQFQDILNDDRSCASAEYHINECKGKMVPRWHYRMLNDKTRNQFYKYAIHQTVRPSEDTVLDLGSGTGLLAMYAAECNPDSIVGIEANKMAFEIATYLLQENKLDTIKIINNWSYCTNESDIGGRKSLLITEMFDAGLLGEGIIESLDHAFKNLLLENARVLPQRAEFFVRGVHSNTLMKAYHLSDYTKTLLNVPLNQHVLAKHEAYDCEDIHKYADLQYMTEPQLLLTVDFNNPVDIEKKLRQIEHYCVQLKPLGNGLVSTIIGWFNLHLSDNVSLTTDPLSQNRANAWQQAVFSNFLPRNIKDNSPLALNFLVDKGSKIDLIPDSENGIKIPISVIQFLNDEVFMELIANCVGNAHMYLQVARFEEITVVDFAVFPLFGLLMLRRGAHFLYCFANSKESKDFFENVFTANNIHKERYKIFESCDTPKIGRVHAIFTVLCTGYNIISGTHAQNAIGGKHHHLVDGGLFVPHKMTIIGQVIHSPWLNLTNRVNDDNVGYKLAHHMNKFQLSADYCVNLSHFEYTALTEPVALGDLENMASGIISCSVKRAGPANAILCWYDIEMLEKYGYISTNRVNSFSHAVAFLADPELHFNIGDTAEIICCVDEKHGFKIILDAKDQ